MLRCRVALGTVTVLARIAESMGYLWGSRPQIGKALEAIARHPEAISAVLKELEKEG
jgi:hypothetical protein